MLSICKIPDIMVIRAKTNFVIYGNFVKCGLKSSSLYNSDA